MARHRRATTARASDKKLAASVVEQALADDLKTPATGGAGLGHRRPPAPGRRRHAGRAGGGPAGPGRSIPAPKAPALLALELMDPKQPQAEPMRAALPRQAQGRARGAHGLRPRAARGPALRRSQRSSCQRSRAEQPELPEPWLLLGTLQAQANQDAAGRDVAQALHRAGAGQRDAEERSRGLTQAYLSLVADRRAAQGLRRRRGLAGQHRQPAGPGRHAERAAPPAGAPGQAGRGARTDPRACPSATPPTARRSSMAEVQLLRDNKQYKAAYDMLAQASAAAPNDADLIYDQAMVAEKLNRLDEMERLLRRLIALKPDNQNAYNALGYSLADRKVRLHEATHADPEGGAVRARRSLHRRQPGLGRVPHGQQGRGAAHPARPPTSTGPIRRSPPTWARCCGAIGQRDRAHGDLEAKACCSTPRTRRCRRRSSACA